MRVTTAGLTAAEGGCRARLPDNLERRTRLVPGDPLPQVPINLPAPRHRHSPVTFAPAHLRRGLDDYAFGVDLDRDRQALPRDFRRYLGAAVGELALPRARRCGGSPAGRTAAQPGTATVAQVSHVGCLLST